MQACEKVSIYMPRYVVLSNTRFTITTAEAQMEHPTAFTSGVRTKSQILPLLPRLGRHFDMQGVLHVYNGVVVIGMSVMGSSRFKPRCTFIVLGIGCLYAASVAPQRALASTCHSHRSLLCGVEEEKAGVVCF